MDEDNKEINENRSYTTGQAHKLLDVSFITIKRWIYSKKLFATKASNGRYHITGSELKRLRDATTDKFASALIEMINSKKVAYLRELQVTMEDFKYNDTRVGHSEVYHKLLLLAGTSRLNTRLDENRWYYPKGISWDQVQTIATEKATFSMYIGIILRGLLKVG